jgi:hypothetical protein
VTYDEAESEPGVLFDNVSAVVPAVVTPADDALVSFYLLTEGVLSARKYDTHGWGLGRWIGALSFGEI